MNQGSGGHLNTKMPSYQYEDIHYKDKMASRPAHLYNGNPYTQERWSLHWDGAQVSTKTTMKPVTEQVPRETNDNQEPGPRFNIKTSYQYRKSHRGDKTVVRLSYLHNGISYTCKMLSLYWISPQDPCGSQRIGNGSHHWCLNLLEILIWVPRMQLVADESLSRFNGYMT